MNVGDYVKTNDGGIGKITKCPFNTMYTNEIWGDIDNTKIIITDRIYKTSPNIIDLIEVGDYVNGKRVEWIGYDLYRENEDKTLTGIGEKRILFNEFTKDSVREKGIKSIVTKEQFSQMEYKIQ